ncbi:hypothetical protein Tdes44962_MAKER06945 [Teratosphaeria destructans]|uniref:Uncharacterized protein n=1 Tax=Teratosphaeria destructans TaxID=418781 RepID=A0A9W7T0K5_9PEZI|nr:hypothetical protein Tdes44962_MAKER06945 [Teratosphaeria destructans]
MFSALSAIYPQNASLYAISGSSKSSRKRSGSTKELYPAGSQEQSFDHYRYGGHEYEDSRSRRRSSSIKELYPAGSQESFDYCRYGGPEYEEYRSRKRSSSSITKELYPAGSQDSFDYYRYGGHEHEEYRGSRDRRDREQLVCPSSYKKSHKDHFEPGAWDPRELRPVYQKPMVTNAQRRRSPSH